MDDDAFLDDDELEEEEEQIDPETLAPDLFAAAKGDDLGKVKELVEQGVPITHVDEATLWTALHWAANNGNLELVRLLLGLDAAAVYKEAKKNQAAMGENPALENTPLHWASYRGHIQVVWALLEAGYDPDDTDESLNTPLHLAAASGHAKIVQVLLQDGATPSLKNKFHNSALALCTSDATRNLLENALDGLRRRPTLSAADKERLYAVNLDGYARLQQRVRDAAEGRVGEVEESKDEKESAAAGEPTTDVLIERLREVTALAGAMGVPPEVLEVGAAGEGAIRLRGDLRSAMADLEAVAPVLTQSQYTALVNPLKLLVARFEKGTVPCDGAILDAARTLVRRSHCEYWLQVALRQVEPCECATEATVNLMGRLRSAIEAAAAEGADAAKVGEARERLGVLEGELEMSRALVVVPTVRLPIEEAPKDYWGDEDKGKFWDDYPEWPLEPPLPEDAPEDAKPEYKWIPSESLAALRSAVNRLDAALESVADAKVNEEVKAQAEEVQKKAAGDLKLLENKDEEDREKEFVAVEKAAKKARKKMKKSKKK